MNADDLMDRVRAMGATMKACGSKLRVSAPSELPEELLEALKAQKSEVLAAIRGGESIDVYDRRITNARSWVDLYEVLGDAEVAYAEGELAGEEVETLAARCRRMANSLPEHTPRPE
jgi:hypothetical protein